LLSQKSLRVNFLIRLIAAMAILLSLFSFFLYNYIRYSVETELETSLTKHAKYLLAQSDLQRILRGKEHLPNQTLNIEARLVDLKSGNLHLPHFDTIEKGKHIYLKGYFPFEKRSDLSLMLEYDITLPMHMVHEAFRAIVFLNILLIGLIILYAFFLTNMLISPIEFFSKKLSRMNENILEPLDTEKVPLEFKPLASSINQLVGRIKSHLLYKKELSVGAAHELKTPMAVMKTRSQVALLKHKKSLEDLEKVLRENLETIDRMNHMVEAILQFGRAEGAQFEHPRSIDLIEFLQEKIEEFEILARSEGKKISTHLSPDRLEVTLQPLLLTQIIQNLMQNALRYTPKGGTLHLSSYRKENDFVVEIQDEGPGIDEAVDLFAPFKRSKDSPGAGLGLFLVKNAVDAIGGTISIKNNHEGKGATATLILPLNLSFA